MYIVANNRGFPSFQNLITMREIVNFLNFLDWIDYYMHVSKISFSPLLNCPSYVQVLTRIWAPIIWAFPLWWNWENVRKIDASTTNPGAHTCRATIHTHKSEHSKQTVWTRWQWQKGYFQESQYSMIGHTGQTTVRQLANLLQSAGRHTSPKGTKPSKHARENRASQSGRQRPCQHLSPGLWNTHSTWTDCYLVPTKLLQMQRIFPPVCHSHGAQLGLWDLDSS